MEFVDLEEARQRDGLRLVSVGGVPSPWSEAAKGIFHVKKIPFVGVRLMPGDESVPQWTGCDNAPVAMFDDEAPRSGWAEILLLAERLAPQVPLLPSDPEERVACLGLSHEICGEMGLGWCRRLEGVYASLESDSGAGYPKPIAEYLGRKYGYRPGEGDAIVRRMLAQIELLSERLRRQLDAGSRYYLGTSLTAVDLYSAAFMAIFEPLPPGQCPMPEALRPAFAAKSPEVEKALDPALLEHRDFVYAEHLELPLTL